MMTRIAIRKFFGSAWGITAASVTLAASVFGIADSESFKDLVHPVGQPPPEVRSERSQTASAARRMQRIDQMVIEATELTSAGTGARDGSKDKKAFGLLLQTWRLSPFSARTLGWHYYFGIATPKNIPKALEIWNQALTMKDLEPRLREELIYNQEKLRDGYEFYECGKPVLFCPRKSTGK